MMQETSDRQLAALALLRSLPDGYSEMLYEQRRYGVTVKHLNNGRSIKLYAEDLAGNDFISANLYSGASSDYFRPCEMPAEKVLRFLEGAKAA